MGVLVWWEMSPIRVLMASFSSARFLAVRRMRRDSGPSGSPGRRGGSRHRGTPGTRPGWRHPASCPECPASGGVRRRVQTANPAAASRAGTARASRVYSTVMSVHRPCVAQAVHGLDIAGLGRHVFQLVPQPLHCDGEGVFVHILRPVRPDPVHQGGPGKGWPRCSTSSRSSFCSVLLSSTGTPFRENSIRPKSKVKPSSCTRSAWGAAVRAAEYSPWPAAPPERRAW